jgi:glucuronoarabinoxylan endo-1,4-beta-xylanase
MAAIILAVLPLLSPTLNVNAADVTVNLNAPKQEIDGFGASSAWCGKISDNVMNVLYGDLGFSILRVRIEEGIEDNWKTGNFSKWGDELANAKKAMAKGAIVFATPWNAPASLRLNTGTSNAKYSTDPTKWATYRDYLNAYVKYFKDNNAPLHAIAVQNEPDYAKDWTYWSATQIHDFITSYGATINTRLISAESFNYSKSLYDQILNDPKALANVSILGMHLYGTSVNNFAYPLFESKGRPAGKKLWMTEHYIGEKETDQGPANTVAIGKEIHDCMVTGNMSGYTYWWITWPNGLATGSGTIYQRAYAIGQFSKHIRPGYFRVDATPTPTTNVHTSAYSGDGKVVIVAVNTGTSAVNQKFAIQNGTVAQFATWQTASGKNMVAGSAAQVSGGSFTASLPAQSITTFVGVRTDKVPTRIELQTRIDNSFKAEVTNGHLVITPASFNDTYSFRVFSPNGTKSAIRSENRGVSEIPASTRGMYLVEIRSNGIVHRKMVPLL